MGENRGGRPSCPSFRMHFKVLPDKRLRAFFLKKDLPPSVVQVHFGSGQFIMPSHFDLPLAVLKRLGIDHYRIQPGSYTVYEDDDTIMMDI